MNDDRYDDRSRALFEAAIDRRLAEQLGFEQAKRWYLRGLAGRDFRKVAPADVPMVLRIAGEFCIPFWLVEHAADCLQLARHCSREEAYARLLYNLAQQRDGQIKYGPVHDVPSVRREFHT